MESIRNIPAIAKQMKAALVKAYPGVKFSVSTQKHYDWIQVYFSESIDRAAYSKITSYYSKLYNVQVTN